MKCNTTIPQRLKRCRLKATGLTVYILRFFHHVTILVRGVDTTRCFACEEDRSPPIKTPICNKTTSCGELSPYCFAQVVKQSNGNIKFSMGCASPFSGYRCGEDAEACKQELGRGAEACKTTCCTTKECNVSFPDLNSGNGLVLGVIPMIASIIWALAFM